MNKDSPNTADSSEKPEENRKRSASSEELIPDDRYQQKETKKIDVASETSEQSREDCVTGEQSITHDIHTYEHSRSEICKITDQDIFTIWKEGSENSRMDENALLAQTALDKTHIDRLVSEIQEFAESFIRKKENRTTNIIGENTSSLGQTALDKSEVELLNTEECYLLNQEKKRSTIISENTSSNINILQKQDTEGKVRDIRKMEGFNMYSLDNAASVPGPSCARENSSHSYLSADTIENTPSPTLQTVENRESTLMCLACNQKDMHEHLKVGEGKNLYKCCQCVYYTYILQNLMDHIYESHLLYCKECNVNYLEEGLHGIEQTCNACGKNFTCKSLLEDHYSVHNEHHKTYCMLCQESFKNHTKDCRTYKCCIFECPHESTLSILKIHICKHIDLKLFKCTLCGKRYSHYITLLSHSKKCKEL